MKSQNKEILKKFILFEIQNELQKVKTNYSLILRAGSLCPFKCLKEQEEIPTNNKQGNNPSPEAEVPGTIEPSGIDDLSTDLSGSSGGDDLGTDPFGSGSAGTSAMPNIGGGSLGGMGGGSMPDMSSSPTPPGDSSDPSINKDKTSDGSSSAPKTSEELVTMIVDKIYSTLEKQKGLPDIPRFVGATKESIQNILGNFSKAGDVADALVKKGSEEQNIPLIVIGNSLKRFLITNNK
jgi:hypothetical protein